LHGHSVSASCGVTVYAPGFAGTHCTYRWRDGQAELTQVAGYIIRVLTITYPSINQAQRR